VSTFGGHVGGGIWWGRLVSTLDGHVGEPFDGHVGVSLGGHVGGGI